MSECMLTAQNITLQTSFTQHIRSFFQFGQMLCLFLHCMQTLPHTRSTAG